MADAERGAHGDPEADLELPSLRSAFRRGTGSAPAEPAPEPEQDTSILPATLTEEPSEHRRPRRPVRLHVPGHVAAPLVGIVVGLVIVGLGSAGLHACTSMRGTSSCGNPGLLLLLAIAVVAVVLGSLLLRLAGIGPHASTSLLAVGLLVVVVLLALLPLVGDRRALVVVPLASLVAYLASWWLTSTYVEPGERTR
jgi:hypothetical protein